MRWPVLFAAAAVLTAAAACGDDGDGAAGLPAGMRMAEVRFS